MVKFTVYFVLLSPIFGWTQEEYFGAQKFETPRRDVAVIVSKEGYYPNNIVVFQGERIRLFLTSARREEGCLNMASKDFSLSVSQGEVAEGIIFFNQSGVYEFHCPIGKISGRFTVLEKGFPLHESQEDDSWRPEDQ